MPSSPNYKRDYEVVPTKVRKDGRAGRRIKKVYAKRRRVNMYPD